MGVGLSGVSASGATVFGVLGCSGFWVVRGFGLVRVLGRLGFWAVWVVGIDNFSPPFPCRRLRSELEWTVRT